MSFPHFAGPFPPVAQFIINGNDCGKIGNLLQSNEEENSSTRLNNLDSINEEVQYNRNQDQPSEAGNVGDDNRLLTDANHGDKCESEMPVCQITDETRSTASQSDWAVIQTGTRPNSTDSISNNNNSSSVDGFSQIGQWSSNVKTRNASTMTDWNKASNDVCPSKPSTDGWKMTAGEVGIGCFDNCLKIHLQRQGTAMAEYLSRLQPTALPISIQQFLNRHNIKDVSKSVDCANLNNKKGAQRNSTEISALDGTTLYCCSECNMAYPDKGRLETHIAGHRGERRFECNVCGACLKRKEHLDQHKRGHSEERPFVCKVCCKGFKRNEHLRRHFVIHSGNKLHACVECGKAFSRKDHLNKHTQTHIMKRVKTDTRVNNIPIS